MAIHKQINRETVKKNEGIGLNLDAVSKNIKSDGSVSKIVNRDGGYGGDIKRSFIVGGGAILIELVLHFAKIIK